MSPALASSWMLRESPSIEDVVVARELADETPPRPPVTDPRTRILTDLLDLLDPRDRQLLEATTDGATVAEIARAQGVPRQTLSDRRAVLLGWLAYCAPIVLRIEPVLATAKLSRKAELWWRWHQGRPVAALERAHPVLVVERSRWLIPRRR